MTRLAAIAALALAAAGCSWSVPERVTRLVPPANAGLDDTEWLQGALDAGGTVIVPPLDGGRCYRVRGLWITRDRTSLVSDGACLEALGPGPVRRSSGDGDAVAATAVLFVNREDDARWAPFRIRLSGLRLVVPPGLGMHGISIFGRGVVVERVSVSGSPVDAVSIGGRAGGEYAEDVEVTQCTFESAERNVVSVTGVDGLRLDGNVVANARTDPGAGIDLEPDNEDDPILDVRITRNTIRGNAAAGVLLALETPTGPPLRADRIRIDGNDIAGNGGAGIEVTGGPKGRQGTVTIVANTFRENSGGRLNVHDSTLIVKDLP